MMSFADFADSRPIMEATEPTAQTRSIIFALMRHIQQLHQEMLANRNSTIEDKTLSAQNMCLAALIGVVTGVITNDSAILQRARGIWA
jgi:hypothetical protein